MQNKCVIKNKEDILTHMRRIFPDMPDDALQRASNSISSIKLVTKLDFEKRKKGDDETMEVENGIVKEKTNLGDASNEEKTQES